jgi:hypothetical protein
MMVKMEARSLWDVVEYGDAGRQDDRMAVDAIFSAVPPEMIRSLTTKKTAKEAWEAIQSLHVGSTVHASRLCSDYDTSGSCSRSVMVSMLTSSHSVSQE